MGWPSIPHASGILVNSDQAPERHHYSDNGGDERELPEKLHLCKQGDGAKDDGDFQEEFCAVVVVSLVRHVVGLFFHFPRVFLEVYRAIFMGGFGRLLITGRFCLRTSHARTFSRSFGFLATLNVLSGRWHMGLLDELLQDRGVFQYRACAISLRVDSTLLILVAF